MTRFVVVRHGETQWNLESRIQGHGDSALTAKGLEQAEASARRLAAGDDRIGIGIGGAREHARPARVHLGVGEALALPEAALARKHAGKRIVAVTHGGVLAVLYRIVHGIPLAHAHKVTISNASYNAVAFDGDAWRLEAWDDTAHLGDATPFVES